MHANTTTFTFVTIISYIHLIDISFHGSTLQVVTFLVTMVSKILELATGFVKKDSLSQRSWWPNGSRVKTLIWKVAGYLILRFGQESISQKFYFQDFLGKYETRALHFTTQELSTFKCIV